MGLYQNSLKQQESGSAIGSGSNTVPQKNTNYPQLKPKLVTKDNPLIFDQSESHTGILRFKDSELLMKDHEESLYSNSRDAS